MAYKNGAPRATTNDIHRTRARQAGYKTPGASKPLFGVSRPKMGVGGQRPLSQSIKNGAMRSITKPTPRTRRP